MGVRLLLLNLYVLQFPVCSLSDGISSLIPDCSPHHYIFKTGNTIVKTSSLISENNLPITISLTDLEHNMTTTRH